MSIVTPGRLKSVQWPALEKKTPYGISGFDATTCLFYMMLSGLGFRYFVAIKAVQSRERIKTIEERCLSISAAIFVAKKWIKERQSVVQNTRAVILSGNEVGNVIEAVAAGVSVTQNTSTMHLSGNAIGNVIGKVDNVIGAAAGGGVIQNMGTMRLSGNAIGNVIGKLPVQLPVRLKISVLLRLTTCLV